MNQSNSAQVLFKLSVVVPAYNEEATIGSVVKALLAEPVPGGLEVIVVDDGSVDKTRSILSAMKHPNLKVVLHERNQGKGAAVRTGMRHATGTHLLVFDADSEYSPADIPRLVDPIVTGRAEIVYGTRRPGIHTMLPTFSHAFGNKVMTTSANILFSTAISDLHTCLKLFPLPLLRAMVLKEKGFGLDTEITCEMLRMGFRPYEVPVSYVGRSKEEGKKITVLDAFECYKVMFKVRARGKQRPGLRDKSLAPKVGLESGSVPASEVHGSVVDAGTHGYDAEIDALRESFGDSRRGDQ